MPKHSSDKFKIASLPITAILAVLLLITPGTLRPLLWLLAGCLCRTHSVACRYLRGDALRCQHAAR